MGHCPATVHSSPWWLTRRVARRWWPASRNSHCTRKRFAALEHIIPSSWVTGSTATSKVLFEPVATACLSSPVSPICRASCSRSRTNDRRTSPADLAGLLTTHPDVAVVDAVVTCGGWRAHRTEADVVLERCGEDTGDGLDATRAVVTAAWLGEPAALEIRGDAAALAAVGIGPAD